MTKFDTEKYMDDSMKKAIIKSINELYNVEYYSKTPFQVEPIEVQQMLYKLLDGEDYSAMIINDPLMLHFQKKDVLSNEYQLYSKILDICFIVAGYSEIPVYTE